MPVGDRLLQENVFTEDTNSQPVVNNPETEDYSYHGYKTLEENISEPNNELKITGQPVYINPDITRSCDTSEATPPVVSKSRGSNFVLTKSESDPVIKSCENTSTAGTRPCPLKRTSKPKQRDVLTDNSQILHV